MNVAAEKMFGTSQRQAIGRELPSLAPDLAELVELLERSRSSGNSFGKNLSINVPQPGYSEVEVVTRITPISDIRPAEIVVEFHDATHWRQHDRDEMLINQRGASRRIIRQLAHEIRNPLGGLRGAAQLLESQFDNPELLEYTRVIIGEADRLVELTNELLGPRREFQYDHVNIHELVEHVLLLIESEAPEDVEIVRDYDPSLPEIELDKDRIIQSFLNLARNAVQAADSKGRVIVRTRALTNYVIGNVRHRLALSIEFEDNGPGISPEIADSIFYPLVTGRSGGTGLGLPLAQDLVRGHGGLIEFSSEPGQTIFMARLPLHPVRDSEQ